MTDHADENKPGIWISIFFEIWLFQSTQGIDFLNECLTLWKNDVLANYGYVNIQPKTLNRVVRYGVVRSVLPLLWIC